MHVIQTVANLAERIGGPARTLRDLTGAFHRRGVAVSLLASNDRVGDGPLVLPEPGVADVQLLPVERRLGMRTADYAGAVARIAAAASGDVILHDNGIWLPVNWQAADAARRAGMPYVVSPHGTLDPWSIAHRGGRKRIAWRLYQRRVLMRAAGLLATAEQERAAVRARVPERPIAMIPNGVVCPPLPDQSHRLAATSRTLLFMSRLDPKKNIAGLLESWAAIAADPGFADWTLRIAGPDERGHRADMTALAARLGVTSRVVFDDMIAERDKAATFAATDVFILPSFTENFGIVVTEALSHGVPVIASRGTPWAGLAEQRCGWWAGPDTRELTGAICAALSTEPAERLEMGRRGHAWVTRAFDWDAIAGQMLTYYEWLIHGGATPDFVDV